MFPTSILARLTGINWPLIGLVALLQALWTYHWYNRGADACERRASSVVIDSVNERLPVVQQAERDAARLEQELRTIRERLDEQASKPIASDCSISPDELQLYREAASKTRR